MDGDGYTSPDLAQAVEDMTTELIDLLKERLRVTSDQELAERLKVGRSTIANWRRRRRVPNDVPLW